MTTMLCHKCRRKAAIRMAQHRLNLCKEHYIEWFLLQVERTVKKYHMFTPEERILVAVSGGKDSLALWDVLGRLGYMCEGLHIQLGIRSDGEYSAQSEAKTREFATSRGLKLHIVDIRKIYGESVIDMAKRTHRGKAKPCSVCGLVKRHIMNRFAHQGNFDLLLTGHNLDDEDATLFGNIFNWQVPMLQRQAPTLDEAPGLVRKAKPLCRFYERETAAYAILTGISYVEDECPFAEGSTSIYYKNILNHIEMDQPGAKLRLYVGFLKAKRSGMFANGEFEKGDRYDGRCNACGQLTTAPGFCAFCRLLNDEQRNVNLYATG